MILHISIPAKHPAHVAAVLAKITGGVSKAFPPVEGGFMVYTNDQNSTGIEVYPDTIVLIPGTSDQEKFQVKKLAKPSQFSATHFALSIELGEKEIKKIATEEGWRLCFNRRGNRFNVYEFWIENRFMVELIVPEDTKEALAALRLN